MKNLHYLLIGVFLLFFLVSCSETYLTGIGSDEYRDRRDSVLVFRAEPRAYAEIIEKSSDSKSVYFSVVGTSYKNDWVEVYLKYYPFEGLSKEYTVDSVRAFLDKASFQNNAVRNLNFTDDFLSLYAEPRKGSYSFGEGRIKDEIDYPVYTVAGNIEDKEWVLVEAHGKKKGSSYSDRSYKTMQFYMPREELVKSAYFGEITGVYTNHTYVSYIWSKFWNWVRNIYLDFQYSSGIDISWWRSIPVIVLVLLVINVLTIFLASLPKLQVFVEYITLLGVFGFEFIYFYLLDKDFWFCQPDTQGWLLATLMFIISISALVVQCFRFTTLLQHIQLLTRPISTFTGLTLFKFWVVLFFIIAIISGGELTDKAGTLCVFGIVLMQFIQVLTTLSQLRRTPLIALATAVILPLGALAILFSFLKIFGMVILFALVGGIIYAWATAKSGSGSVSSKQGYAGNCPHYSCPYCNFITGGRSECSVYKGGRCKHGQI